MTIHRRSLSVYASLVVAILLIGVWLVYEHHRTEAREQAALLNRAHDIAIGVSAVIQSESKMLIVSQSRIEAALNQLTQSDELQSVALFSLQNQIVATAGKPIELEEAAREQLARDGYYWGTDSVIVTEIVSLGDIEERPAVLVVDEEKIEAITGPGRPPGGPDSFRGDRRGPPRDEEPGPPRAEHSEGPPQSGPEAKQAEGNADGGGDPNGRGAFGGFERRGGGPGGPEGFGPDGPGRGPAPGPGGPGDPRGGPGDFRHGSGRGFPYFPWWRIDKDEMAKLREKEGVHGFMLALAAGDYEENIARDLRLRFALGAIALLAMAGLGFAWHNFARSAELQMRLVRASEMNTHLREMNLAAAGLAHETRNPLNIIRGLAQMISRQGEANAEIRQKTQDITSEVDRVTNRLNQFIDYSKPPEIRPAPAVLKNVANDVARALETDREDKNIQMVIFGPDLTVQVDESLLRQVLFNLLLNAIQAVPEGGRIEIRLERLGRDEAAFEVNDDGPGVPKGAEEDIFRPYYTASEQGTGLGLAVVRQLVLAHQWEIAYRTRETGGASFRVSGLRVG